MRLRMADHGGADHRNMTGPDSSVVWVSLRKIAFVAAVVGVAVTLRNWRRARRTIRFARESGHQMEVIARLRAAMGAGQELRCQNDVAV